MKQLVVLSFLLFNTLISSAQVKPLLPIEGFSDEGASYFNLEDRNRAPIHIKEEYVKFKYILKNKRTESFLLRTLNNKREVQSSFLLQAKAGVNYYNVQISAFGEDFISGEIHYIDFQSKAGTTEVLEVQLKEKVLIDPPSVDISVLPQSIDCNNVQSSIVQYMSNISGGRPPFAIEWKIADFSGNLLFAPDNKELSTNNNYSKITVENSLNYTVTLKVLDACGAESVRIAKITCEVDNSAESKLHLEFLQQNTKGDKQ